MGDQTPIDPPEQNTANATTQAAASKGGLEHEIARRRTFAIIAHPDAGKTTLTEKLLLFGGAIQLAGQVKAKKNQRGTSSDWMAIERARGISVATSVMTFEYGGAVFNLLDTPGHEDFADQTYRTLTAVDSAIMVIDAAKGIEARTLKLFEICRLRDIPIITFVNKMDRQAREPLDLLDEVENALALDTTPMVWPIGNGRTFAGTYDFKNARVRRVDEDPDGQEVDGPANALFDTLLQDDDVDTWREEVALVNEASSAFDLKAYREGTLTPVYFGSALRNFGVRDLLDALVAFAPPPRNQKSSDRIIDASEKKMTGIVFKIQANMDKNHRDRIAFMRVCSGRLTRGMKAKLVRTGKTMALQVPQFFFAQDRSLAEEAFAGDIVGLPTRGTLRIGDALTEGEDVKFLGIPSFAPEILRRVRLDDAIQAKKLKDALRELAQEGVIQLFTPLDGTQPVVGVIGALQLDVLGERLNDEYGLSTGFDPAPYSTVRWISSHDASILKDFAAKNKSSIAEDQEGATVYLAASVYDLSWKEEKNPDVKFEDIKTISVA